MRSSLEGNNEIALRDKNQLTPHRSLSGKKGDIGEVKLWDALIAQGKVTEEQLEQALEIEKSDPRDLGKIMVSLGFISESDLAQAQAQRLRLDYIELTERDVDRGVLGLVPERVLRKHRAVPLRVDHARRLVVAMSDPTNIHALED